MNLVLRLSLAICILLSCTRAIAIPADVAVFNNPSFVQTCNSPSCEATNLINALQASGLSVTTFSGYDAASITNAFATSSVVAIPEMEVASLYDAMSPAARESMRACVTAGGRLLVIGTFGSSASTLLTAALGAPTAVTLGAGCSAPGSLNAAAAAGTTFSGGPSALDAANGSYAVSGWPTYGRVIYGTGNCTWVATAPAAAGAVGFVAYDFYDTAQSIAAPWIEVTRRMVDQLRMSGGYFSHTTSTYSPFNGTAPVQAIVPGAPPASGSVLFSFNLNADLDYSTEFFDVRLNGSLLGTVAPTGVQCGASTATLAVSASAFNSSRGSSSTLTIQLVPSTEVNYCPGSVSFGLSYPSLYEFSHSSASISPFMYGSPAAYTIPSAPTAAGTVSLEFNLTGDFDLSMETFDVRLNGLSVGTLTPALPQCSFGYRTLSLAPSVFNAARGSSSNLNVQLVPSYEVNYCSGSVQTTVRYSASVAPVTGVIATDGASAEGIAVSWNQHASALGYTILRRTASSAAVQVGVVSGGTTTSFMDNGATSLVPYWYSVQALFGGSSVPPSLEDSGWRNVNGPSASASDGTYSDRVHVTWPAVTAASGYRLYRWLPGGTPTLLAGLASSTTSYADTSASAGVVYNYCVSLVHSLGESTLGPTNSGYRGYSVPVGVSAGDGTSASAIGVSWTAFPSATGYTIWRRTSSTAAVQIGAVAGGANTTYSDTSAMALLGYFYSVKAVLGSTTTGLSAENDGWRNVTAPSVIASDGTYSDRVQLNWSATSASAGYRIYRSASGSFAQIGAVSSASTSYADTTATPGVVYTYAITYVHSFGESIMGATNSGFRATTIPTNVIASDGTSATAVGITWSPVTNATSYSVYRRSGSAAPALIGNTTGTSYSYPVGTALSSDFYSVRATVSGVLSGYSAEDAGWRNVVGPSASASDGTYGDRVQVSWSALTSATGYWVYRWTGSASPILLGTTSGSTTSYSDTSATPGTIYSYAISATHSLGASLLGVANSGYRNTTVPQLVDASDGTFSSQVLVSWQAVPNATSYRIYRRGTSGSEIQVGTVSAPATNFAHVSAVQLSAGYYRVRSVVSGIESLPSAEDYGWRNVAGPAVSASDGNYADRVQLSWTVGSGAAGHRIYRWTSGGSIGLLSQLSSTASSFADTTAVPGTTYFYAVSSTHTLGESLLGAADSGYRLVNIPQNVAASDGTSASAVNITWSSVQNATAYSIYRRTGSATATLIATVGASTTSYANSTAAAVTNYTYSVRATVGGLLGPSSLEDVGWRNVIGPTASASDGLYSDRVQVSWSTSSGSIGYRLYRWASGGSPSLLASLASTSSSYADTSAVPGTVYSYAITSVHSIGESLLGTSNTGFRLQTVPQSVLASDGTSATSVHISWQAVPGATSYLVFRRISATSLTQVGSVTGGTTAFAYTGATALSVSSYGVKAIVGGVTGALSTEDSGWRNTTAPAIVASDTTYSDRVQLNWTPSSGSSGHRVYRWTNSTSPTLLVALSSTASSYADTSAVPGTVYTYALRTVHALGESLDGPSDSGVRSWTVPLTVTASDGTSSNSVSITWQSVPAASGYRVYRRTSSGTASQIASVSGSVLTYADSANTQLTMYLYSVRAVFGATQGSASTEDAGWRNAPPVTGVAASDGTYTTRVRVSWYASGFSTGYKIFRQYGSGGYSQIGAVSATTLSYDDLTVPAGVAANYYVVATHSLGQTNPSIPNSGFRSIGVVDATEENDGTSPPTVVTLDLPAGGLSLGSPPNEISPLDTAPPPDSLPGHFEAWNFDACQSCPQAVRALSRMVELIESGDSPYPSARASLEDLRAILPQDGINESPNSGVCRILAGDVNLDDSIDLLDVEAQLEAWAGEDLLRGDVNRDGWIDLLDHLFVLEAVFSPPAAN